MFDTKQRTERNRRGYPEYRRDVEYVVTDTLPISHFWVRQRRSFLMRWIMCRSGYLTNNKIHNKFNRGIPSIKSRRRGRRISSRLKLCRAETLFVSVTSLPVFLFLISVSVPFSVCSCQSYSINKSYIR